MEDFSIVVVKNIESVDLLDTFAHKKVFTSAVDALQYLEQDPADVLVTEYDMPEMNGMDLIDALRDIDADRDHYTWILMTGDGQAGYPAESEIAADSVISNPDPDQIRNTVIAGSRMAARLNTLMNRISHLEQRCEDLEKRQLLDPVTGLGNRRYAEQILQDTIRQVESRGGAVCFLSLVLLDYDKVINTYDQKIANTLVSAVADRIQHLVRPLDVVSYFDRGEFALIMIQPTIEQCTAECYQRIADSVSMKSYKTPAGFLETRIAMSICAATAETGAPDPEVIIHTAQENIRESTRT
ncbi:MAG: diguanylate cyclase, partial [Pseudomonadales bacterium]|nr:diguanylate cyclase [Pseudomonadales bacterium]